MPDPDALDYALKWMLFEDKDWTREIGDSGWLNAVEAFMTHYSTYLATQDDQ